MAFEYTGMTKFIARAAAVAVIAFSASACSVIPDWMGGDATSADTPQDQADQQMAANQSSPDLNSVPDKPNAPSTSDEQKTLGDSLGADRAQNQYSADQLRGGTEAAAAPPGAPAPVEQTVAANPAPAASASAPDNSTVPPPPSSESGSIDAAAAANAAPPAAATADNSAPAAPAPAEAPQQQVAMNAAPPAVAPSTGPAVPAGSYGTYGTSMVSPSDAALGFKPSQAPPLSPSVAQFVPQPIIARYQQTAALGRAAYSTTSEQGYSAVPVSNSTRAMGGPEHMSGAVIANFDSLNTGGAAMPGYGTYGTPSATVMFAGDRTILDAAAKEQVKTAAAAFQQAGGQGFVRVVGHASGGGDLSSERHMVLNFEHSQARATAVARELIRDGVPADKVLVETGGGMESGASAEIFLQS